MISIDCNIFFFLFFAHFLDIFYEYEKFLSEFWSFQAIAQKENPVFYTPTALLKGLDLHIPSIMSLFKRINAKTNELQAKNLILEGIIHGENYIALRLNIKSPINYDYLNRKEGEFRKYAGELNILLNDRTTFSMRCDLENPNKKNIKLFQDALIQINNKKNIVKNPNFFQNMTYLVKSFFLDFFTFKHFSIGYEESEFILKSNDFLRIFGDVVYNQKDQSLKVQPKIIFSSLKSVLRNKSQNLRYIEKKMMFYVVLFLIYGELRIYKAEHLLKLFNFIMNKFFQKKQLLFFNKNKIDLQTLKANKSIVKCVVCLERVREIVFKPCSHMVICERCLYNLKELKCPMCRKPVDDIILVFGEKERK